MTVAGDTVDEDDETFFVNLSGQTNANVSDGQGLGTITDNDISSLSIDNDSVGENNTSTSTVSFTVSLSTASSKTVTVNWATANSTATAAVDYTAASGTLTYTPGQTSKTVTVTVLGDTIDEIDEQFFVNLSGATNAPISDSQGVGTITDNDTSSLTINNPANALEGDAGSVGVTFTVTMSLVNSRTVTVNYATASGTATSGRTSQLRRGR